MNRFLGLGILSLICCLSACDLLTEDDPLKKVQGMSVVNESGEVVRVVQGKVTGKFTVPLETSATYSTSWLNVQGKPIILADLKGKTLTFEVTNPDVVDVSLVANYAFSIKAKTASSTTVFFKLMEKNTVVFKSPSISVSVKG